jgi:DNA-binding NtrC family response regulator
VTADKPGNSKPLRVLVVDDEHLIRWSINEALTGAGHTVIEAENAASAIGVLTNAPSPDVVLLDYRLPDSTDLTLLSQIRELAPRAAVIFMTAFGSPDVLEGALKLGVYRVLHKPFEVRELPTLVLEAHTSRSS